MPTAQELQDQLVALVTARCLDPLEIVLQDAAVLAPVASRLQDVAAGWARDLLAGDDAQAVAAVVRVMAALYPGDEPFDPPVAWWRTPMGQVTARRVGHPTAERLSYPVAGAMLGMSRQGVHDLVRRGRLTGHPDGGVDPASVRDRLRATPEDRA